MAFFKICSDAVVIKAAPPVVKWDIVHLRLPIVCILDLEAGRAI